MIIQERANAGKIQQSIQTLQRGLYLKKQVSVRAGRVGNLTFSDLLTSEIFTRYPSSIFFAFMLQAAPICRESTSRFPFSEVVSLHRFQLAACKYNYSVFSQLIQYHLSASSTFCFPLSLICFRIAMTLNCECDVVILQIVVPR